MRCVACESENWLELPDPQPARSITTSGMFTQTALGKSHCSNCGMVQRTRSPFLGLTDFYEKNYALYYDRPGAEGFNQARYQQIAEWIAGATPFRPKRVLEIGCGRGWTMREMAKLFPDAVVKGLEPAQANSAAGRAAGLNIFTGRLEEYPTDDTHFDLVYSNHVIQHVVDPVAFLARHAPLLSETGLAIVTVQDAREPTNELLYADQNYSYLPSHLSLLAGKSRLVVSDLLIAPFQIEGVRYSQMAILRRNGIAVAPGKVPTAISLAELYDARREYLLAWKSLDAALMAALANTDRVFNFGAGMYTFLLACYCPNYWSQVSTCLVDGQSGDSFGKPVIDPSSVAYKAGDCVVLGTRPSAQAALAERFRRFGVKVIRWDDRIAA